MSIKQLFLYVVSLMSLLSCSHVTVESYQKNMPRLVIDEFFDGELRAHGVVKNRGGEVTRYFNATISASWDEGVGTLDESFVFDDGELQRRIWLLTPGVDGDYIGTANDVVGESYLKVSGNSLFLEYTLRIPYNDGTLDIKIDDRMYLVAENVLINESLMTKWGVRVGEISLVIEKSL